MSKEEFKKHTNNIFKIIKKNLHCQKVGTKEILAFASKLPKSKIKLIGEEEKVLHILLENIKDNPLSNNKEKKKAANAITNLRLTSSKETPEQNSQKLLEEFINKSLKRDENEVVTDKKYVEFSKKIHEHPKELERIPTKQLELLKEEDPRRISRYW